MASSRVAAEPAGAGADHRLVRRAGRRRRRWRDPRRWPPAPGRAARRPRPGPPPAPQPRAALRGARWNGERCRRLRPGSGPSHRERAGCAASLPSAVTECSTSCRVAITSRVSGRRALLALLDAERRDQPLLRREVDDAGPGHRVGQLDDHLAVGVAEAGPHQRQRSPRDRRRPPALPPADPENGSRPGRRSPAWPRPCWRHGGCRLGHPGGLGEVPPHRPAPPDSAAEAIPDAASRRSVFS